MGKKYYLLEYATPINSKDGLEDVSVIGLFKGKKRVKKVIKQLQKKKKYQNPYGEFNVFKFKPNKKLEEGFSEKKEQNRCDGYAVEAAVQVTTTSDTQSKATAKPKNTAKKKAK